MKLCNYLTKQLFKHLCDPIIMECNLNQTVIKIHYLTDHCEETNCIVYFNTQEESDLPCELTRLFQQEKEGV